MTEHVEVKLLPCPFCGREGWLFKHSSAYTDEYSVRCEHGCCEVGDEFEADAIAAWNTRSTVPNTGLREAADAVLHAFAEGVAWTDEQRSAYVALDAALSTHQDVADTTDSGQAAVDGWKLVPVKLTQGMCDQYDELPMASSAEFVWEEMLAASPTPPDTDSVRREAIEECARYVEGYGGVIPGAAVFAPLVSGNRQPCMSGDPRDRLNSPARRDFDAATASLAAAIRKLTEKAKP